MKNIMQKKLYSSLLAMIMLFTCVGCGNLPEDNSVYKQIIEEDKLSYGNYNLSMKAIKEPTEKAFVKGVISLANQALKAENQEIQIVIRDSENTYFSLGFSNSDFEEMTIGITYQNEILLKFGEIIDTSNLQDEALTDALVRNKAKYYMIAAMMVCSTSEFGYGDVQWDAEKGGIKEYADSQNETQRFYYAYDWAKDCYENLEEGKATSRSYSQVKFWIQKDAFYLMAPDS